jgi:hypothetical protein
LNRAAGGARCCEGQKFGKLVTDALSAGRQATIWLGMRCCNTSSQTSPALGQ